MVGKKNSPPLNKTLHCMGLYTLFWDITPQFLNVSRIALPGEPFFLGRCQSSEPNKGMSVKDGDGDGDASANLHGGM